MITAVFSYVVVGMHSSIAILVAILLINYVYIFVEKIRIDQKFKRSLSQLKLGAYEPPGLTQNPFLDQLKLETVSYNRRIQYLQKEY